MTDRARARRLFALVDARLWSRWDPLGAGAPRDEYTAFVGPIVRLAMAGAPVAAIAAQLAAARGAGLGLEPDGATDWRIAEEIRSMSITD